MGQMLLLSMSIADHIHVRLYQVPLLLGRSLDAVDPSGRSGKNEWSGLLRVWKLQKGSLECMISSAGECMTSS